jgi:hypothetical protein
LRRRRSASGFSLMRDILATQSVNMEMMIIWIDESGCGRPKRMGNMIAHSSQKVPAGRRYRMTFLRLSKTSRPYSMQTTILEKDSKRTWF